MNSKYLVWEVETGTGAFKTFDARGVLRFTKQLSLQPTPFDDKLLNQASAAELQNATRAVDSARITAKYAPGIRPTAAPLFSRARPGDNGEIWLQLFDLSTASTQKFAVVDRDGVEIGRAAVPAGIDLQQVGKATLLGVRTQASGTAQIVELALTRK